MALSASELFFQYSGNPVAKILERIFLILLCVFIAPSFKLREWVLLIVASSLAIGLYATENGPADILFAIDRAAFFAAFIYLVTLLKEAAERSVSVLKLGTYLTKQPAGRRYYSLAFGGHLMGVFE